MGYNLLITLLVNERARSQSDLSLSHPVSKHQENSTSQCIVYSA